ncbi:4-diphosphocytidyl-2-C-methyl-D-erythritol kinase [Lachnospiraceae bacterium TWA4]|nr:4-diphosphocytidyl-2-C-methyl-D-erythritol kinase [Lachnospiraceae bacterium TWA4]
MQQLHLKAMAKINLSLDVLRKREDGYHEVRMIMQMINLYDKICLKKTTEPGIKVDTNLYFLPTNENNLVYKAAKLLIDEFHIEEGVSISLQKFIPVAAGLAGGSSDAACVLYGMNRMFKLGLSLDELMKRGVTLGADIPYCLLRGTALAEGIGEKLTKLPSAPGGEHVLIAKPGISVSTKFVYTNLKINELESHPNIDKQLQAIKNQDATSMIESMGNVLESVTIPAYPIIDTIKQCMMEHGALNAMMSGSGPTVFGIFPTHDSAISAQEALKQQQLAKMIYLTSFSNL